jgi:hypothetical protein
MREKILSYCTFFLIVFAAQASFATVITSSVSQDSVTVGDKIGFFVTLRTPKNADIIPPNADNGFGSFVVKGWTSEKKELVDADSVVFKYVVAQYTPEPCTIPSLTFLQTAGGKTDTLLSPPIPLRLCIVTSGDTANPTVAALKPQQSVGKPSLLWVWILLAVAGGIVAILLLRRFIKRKARKVKEPPPKPPYEEACDALAALDAEDLIAKGMIREYVFNLSDIFKRYIERRFDVNAAEFTTEELLDWIAASRLEKSERVMAEWFFSTTDPVKFAKWLPDTDTVARFGTDVRKFLEMTKPRPEPVAQAALPQKQDASHAA